MPVKQGILFSDEEQGTEVDVPKISRLIAPPTITLFEVRTHCLGI